MPKQQSPGKPNTARYSEQEKAAPGNGRRSGNARVASQFVDQGPWV
ncbi:MAG TPA: hypothetical protein VL595_16930 [Pseudonocardia sp.]|jgi:hypothetical protein|nr:hypothetical protein [Pseudonocardia sp.]